MRVIAGVMAHILVSTHVLFVISHLHIRGIFESISGYTLEKNHLLVFIVPIVPIRRYYYNYTHKSDIHKLIRIGKMLNINQ